MTRGGAKVIKRGRERVLELISSNKFITNVFFFFESQLYKFLDRVADVLGFENFCTTKYESRPLSSSPNFFLENST